VPTTSTFLSPIAIINRFLHVNLGYWIPFLSLDASAASTYLTKWIMWDWAVIALVMWLRVPGLRYGKVKGLVYAVLFTFLDAMIFGTLGVSLGHQKISELIHLIAGVGACRQLVALLRKRCVTGIDGVYLV
jgi:hypothetical protein